MAADPAMAAALRRLRAYLAAEPPATPAEWEREGLPLSVYGAVPRLAAGPPVPAGCDWPAEDRPGPQPENAGLTPGWPPEPPPPPEVAAAVGELAAATRAAERVGAAARTADRENWQLARWVAELEQRVESMGHELELLRGTAGHPSPSPSGGRPAVAPGTGPGGRPQPPVEGR